MANELSHAGPLAPALAEALLGVGRRDLGQFIRTTHGERARSTR